MTTDQLELAIRDSIVLEACKDERSLNYAIRNIEARHAVEGIGPEDKATWEAVKLAHIKRVYAVVAA